MKLSENRSVTGIARGKIGASSLGSVDGGHAIWAPPEVSEELT